MKSRALALIALAAPLLLTACPNPIPVDLASQLVDGGAPRITIVEPRSGAVYGSTVVVSGSVADEDGAVASLILSAPAADVERVVEVANDGTFRTTFSTAGVSTAITLTLTAADWNGNTSTLSRTIENDLAGPHILISEPADFSAYATVVRVTGSVTDADGLTTTTEVSEVSYEIPGTAIAGTLELGAEGEFAFQFATQNEDGSAVVDGSATIRVRAADFNGNESVAAVTIVRAPTGDFSNLTVAPSSRAVTLAWDPVPFAESYTVFEVRYGQSREGVTTPFTWDGLENGEAYRFQVKADVADRTGPDAYSTFVEAMPLSRRTLAPRVLESGYRSITLEWESYPGITEYVVERRLPGEPWSIRRQLPEARFTDTDVAWNRSYEYRVRASAFPEIPSDPTTGWAGRFGRGVSDTLDIATSYMGFRNIGSLDVEGEHMYVADDYFGLRVYDVSQPALPRSVAALALPGDPPSIRAIDVEGSFAYVVDPLVGVHLVDVADPASPRLVSTFNPPGNEWDVMVEGTRAYVEGSEASNTILIVDVSDPENPTQLGSIPAPDIIYGFYADGMTLGMIGREGDFILFDVTDPANVVELGRSGALTSGGSDVVIIGNRAYVADGVYGVFIFDIATPASPSVIGFLDTDGDGRGLDVDLENDRIYLGAGTGGLQVIDISDPTAPALVASFDTPDGAQRPRSHRGFVYVPVLASGLSVIDVSEPIGTQTIGSVEVGGSVRALDVDGTRAYLVNDATDELIVVDISDVTAPQVLSRVASDGIPYDIVVSGDYAYVASIFGDFEIFDVSDPTNPALFERLRFSGFDVFGVELGGPHAYLAVDQSGLAVVDVADPGAPRLLSRLDSVGNNRQLRLAGDYLLMANGDTGMEVVDVSDPSTPTGIGLFDQTNGLFVSAIDVQGHLAYVALWDEADRVADVDSEFKIVDLSDPSNPAQVGSIVVPGEAFSVSVAGSYAAVATNGGGLHIIDVSDPTAPRIVNVLGVGTAAEALLLGSRALIADANRLVIVELEAAP